MTLNAWIDILRAAGICCGDTVIDIGAHVGDTVQVWADIGARVFAYEPQPDIFSQLEKRFSGNPSVVCVQAAVWTKAGTAPLYLNSDIHTNGASLYAAKRNVSKDKSTTVRTVSAEDVIRSAAAPGRVNLVKINAEGVEYEILLALLESGAADLVDAFYVDTHEHKIKGISDLAKQALRAAAAHKNVRLFR